MQTQTKMKEVGKRLKKLRAKNEISQHTLARRVGLSQSHICKIELGESPLSDRYNQKLSKVFRVRSLK